MLTVPDPEQAKPGDHVVASSVQAWPRMTDKQVNAFRRFTGVRDLYINNLARKGPRIFSVGKEYALCVYNHTREF